MRALIACVLFVAVAGQFRFPWWNGVKSDRHNGYTFEYHARHNLVVVRDSRACYLIKAHKNLHYDATQRNTVEDDIIKHIKEKDGLHRETHLHALSQFHDILEAGECARKFLYELDLVLPTAMHAATTTAGTTMGN
ncbi:hypothetical protein LOTGIDRAFT_153684 [Lottia gigantea]|uniref:BRICHOS domain-containing protein n=1 Tax=Lottia gigantea TaxID=225164 RepID=V4A3E2_LOTGI|nr:hypothetical protein LOTGIDRAFT_153684 [Lottia gigantea]ESO91252.1 hypothetical protein LOTGIDRAFT_153684 [Lottia gigantea]